jgi:hypothetical protein
MSAEAVVPTLAPIPVNTVIAEQGEDERAHSNGSSSLITSDS